MPLLVGIEIITLEVYMQNSVLSSNQPHHSKATKLFSLYSVIFLFFYLGDSIMSYFAPIFVEHYLRDPLLLGLVISSSSVIGFFVDIFLSGRFPKKDYYFFLLIGVILALAFPLVLLLPANLTIMILSMAVWGIYFEFLSFSNFRAIHDILPKEKRDFAWGLSSSLNSFAILLGPFIAGILFAIHFRAPLGGALIMFSIALAGTIFFFPFHRQRKSYAQESNINLWKELKIWQLLNSRLWPYLMYTLITFTVSSVFWTIGPVLAEHLSKSHYLGGMLLVAYLLPYLLFGIFSDKIAHVFGRDRSIFASGIIAGICLVIVGVTPSIMSLIVLVFLVGSFLAISTPMVNATFENYVTRLGNSANSLIGLRNSITSVSYIIGPLFSGLIAKFVGYQLTFSIFGLTLALYCIFTYVLLPKRIVLPQHEIKNIEKNEEA